MVRNVGGRGCLQDSESGERREGLKTKNPPLFVYVGYILPRDWMYKATVFVLACAWMISREKGHGGKTWGRSIKHRGSVWSVCKTAVQISASRTQRDVYRTFAIQPHYPG